VRAVLLVPRLPLLGVHTEMTVIAMAGVVMTMRIVLLLTTVIVQEMTIPIMVEVFQTAAMPLPSVTMV